MTPIFAKILCLLPAFFNAVSECETHQTKSENALLSQAKHAGNHGVKLGGNRTTQNRPAPKVRRRTRSSSSGLATQKKNEPSQSVNETPASPSGAPSESVGPKTPKTVLDQILDGLQAYYTQQTDLKADFIQTYTYVKMGRKKVSKGRVFFKTPGRMRFDYQTPSRKLILSDGHTLWIYEPEQFQAFKRDLQGSQLPVAMTFMSGKGDLRAEFDGAIISKNERSAVIELTPKRNEGDYRSLRLEVDLKTSAVMSSTVVDPVGNLNEIRFSNLETNTQLPDAGFRFKVPDGVTVVE